ncbi:MAG: hypothetical protein JWO72_2534 [Caulobacteraceae bacterium]|jgi:hypothetical protein|nr:hypothetical protein [Caulobacteraceae bacterium]
MTPTSTMDDPHPGMMGDGTEEQNLGQRGTPGARITADEIDEAFNGQRRGEARSFASDEQSDRWAALKEHGAAVRDHVANSAEAVRDWAAAQAQIAKQTAADKPVLVVSLSAGTALAIGLAVGFVLGRASNDY